MVDMTMYFKLSIVRKDHFEREKRINIIPISSGTMNWLPTLHIGQESPEEILPYLFYTWSKHIYMSQNQVFWNWTKSWAGNKSYKRWSIVR